MMELHGKLLRLADRLNDHYWSKRMTETDSKFVGELYKSIIDLSNVAYNFQNATKLKMAKLEDENQKLRNESWEDGDKIAKLQLLVDAKLEKLKEFAERKEPQPSDTN